MKLMTPTPTQLTHWKQEIARLLPEKVIIVDKELYLIISSNLQGCIATRKSCDTELIQLIQWVEEKMTDEEYDNFLFQRTVIVDKDFPKTNMPNYRRKLHGQGFE